MNRSTNREGTSQTSSDADAYPDVVVDIKSKYYSRIEDLYVNHRRLFEEPLPIYSVRESEIGVFHSSLRSQRILSIVARCPYKATRLQLESAAYKVYTFLRAFVGNLHKCSAIISVTSNCVTYNDKTRLYKLFYGFHYSSLNTKFASGDVSDLTSFTEVKKAIDFDFNVAQMNDLFRSQFENSASRVVEIVNFVLVITCFVPRGTQIKRHWQVNRLMKVLMPDHDDGWMDGEGEPTLSSLRPSSYTFK